LNIWLTSPSGNASAIELISSRLSGIAAWRLVAAVESALATAAWYPTVSAVGRDLAKIGWPAVKKPENITAKISLDIKANRVISTLPSLDGKTREKVKKFQ
jgi:hypothetical protein